MPSPPRARCLAALLLVLAPAVARPQPAAPQLTGYTKGRVGIGIPAGWKESPLAAPDVLGVWTTDGKNVLETAGLILVGRTTDAEVRLNLKDVAITGDTATTVGGRSARRVEIQDKGAGGAALPGRQARGIGLIVPGVEPGGRALVFVFVCTTDQWERLAPQFEASIRSITIDGKGTPTAGPGGGATVDVVYLDRGQEKPLEGATVVIGRKLHMVTTGPGSPAGSPPASVDALRGDAAFVTGTTAADGTFATAALPPGEYTVAIWKAGHVPVQNRALTVPGRVREYLAPDTGAGAFDRHRTLDTRGVFAMKPPPPTAPAVWGRITLGTRTAATPDTPPAPGEDVTVVIGDNLWLGTVGLTTTTDVVNGDAIYAEVKTNADGTFAVPIPPGEYSLVIWKKGYVPEARTRVRVWPGQTFFTLLKDDAPGGIGRHDHLDTTSKDVPRRRIDPRPGIRGTVRLSDRGVRTPGESVTVLIGTDLRLDHPQIPTATDKVIGTTLVAQTKTDREGQFFAPVAPGTYRVVVWKEGCVPQEFDRVVVPPGVHNVTLAVDNQPGGAGRHRSLDLSGIRPRGGGGGVNPAMAPLLPFLLGAAPPELTPRTVGGVTVSVPADWRKDPDTPPDEGAWLTGKADRPGAYFAVLRDAAFDGLAAMIAPRGVPESVGGRAATGYTGGLKNEPGTRARLIVLADAERDGRRVAFLAKAPEAAWGELEPTFDAILGSVKLPAVAQPPSPPPPAPPPPVAAEDLKELSRVARIPDFKADVAYIGYEDRVVLTGVSGTATVGVAGHGKSVGPTFRAFYAREKAVAAALGDPLTMEQSALNGAAQVQIFEGGVIVQEVASGTAWWQAHPKRPRDLRPADEMIRFPRVLFGGLHCAFAAYPDRVHVWDVAGKVELDLKVGPAGQPIPESFRKVIDRNKLEPRLGRAVSSDAPLFGTTGRVQVYEGGAVAVQPETGAAWWFYHPKRGRAGPGRPPAVSLPGDPNAVVVQLDYVGGYTPPRKTADPHLRIRADGRVTLIDPFGKQPTVEVKLSPENLLSFVKFAVEEHAFFAIDSAAMEGAIKGEAKRLKLPTVLDMPTTVVTIRTAAGVHEVRCFAPEFYAERLPNLKAVQDFEAVHKRLATYAEKLRGP